MSHSVADAYLDHLCERGVDYLFGNAGTDFTPLIDAYARRTAAGERVPTPLTITHEVTAVAMAHGYAMVSGRTPAVMVHTVAGTANAVGGLINAARAQVPMLLTAGRTPLTEDGALGSRDIHIHWAQESFDQGSMVREWVKWDYELRAGSDLAVVIDRALAIAESEPAGPVYLTLPREILAAPYDRSGSPPKPLMTPQRQVPAGGPLSTAAAALDSAETPIIITRSAGRHPAAADALAALAEHLGAPVIDPYPTHSNLDFHHRLHLMMGAERFLAEADVVVVVDSDVPWSPKWAQPRADATVIGIGADPLYQRYPIRGFRVDVNLAGSTADTLDALRARTQSAPKRGERWQQVAENQRAAAATSAEDGRQAIPIAKPHASRVLDELLPPDAIVVDELGVDITQLSLRGPGRFYGLPQSGVLGWGLGAALGAKLAAPERPVVAVVGDGSYLFGAPTSAHLASRRYDLPVLYVVWNNNKWGAVEGATRMTHPEGHAVRHDNFTFAELGPPLDYELICQAAGGHAERVSTPEALAPAIERGLAAVANGQQALLNVIAHEPT